MTSWKKPDQSATAKSPPQEELLILWKGFECTDPGLLSFLLLDLSSPDSQEEEMQATSPELLAR